MKNYLYLVAPLIQVEAETSLSNKKKNASFSFPAYLGAGFRKEKSINSKTILLVPQKKKTILSVLLVIDSDISNDLTLLLDSFLYFVRNNALCHLHHLQLANSIPRILAF